MRWAPAALLIFACSYAIREIERCLCARFCFSIISQARVCDRSASTTKSHGCLSSPTSPPSTPPSEISPPAALAQCAEFNLKKKKSARLRRRLSLLFYKTDDKCAPSCVPSLHKYFVCISSLEVRGGGGGGSRRQRVARRGGPGGGGGGTVFLFLIVVEMK